MFVDENGNLIMGVGVNLNEEGNLTEAYDIDEELYNRAQDGSSDGGEFPVFCMCESCGAFMDFDGDHYICPDCGAKASYEAILDVIDEDNQRMRRRMGLDD